MFQEYRRPSSRVRKGFSLKLSCPQNSSAFSLMRLATLFSVLAEESTAIDEIRCGVKNELSRIAVEIVIAEVTELGAKFEGVAPAEIGQGIGENEGGVAAALREGSL